MLSYFLNAGRKSELAAGILDGSELAGSMSERELLDLTRGTTEADAMR